MDALSVLAAAREPGVASRPALVIAGEILDYAALAARVGRTAAALAALGARRGARVAIASDNSLDAILAILALIEIGATFVPVHPRLTPAEASVILADAAPDLVLRADDLADLSSRSSSDPSQPLLRDRAPIDPALPLAMVYTSGTTGRPKGAILPRRAFVASAAASAANLGFFEHDRWLLCMPLCHVGGLSIVTRCLLARRAVILAPRFDPDAVLAAIDRDAATLLSVVPTMLASLLDRDARGALSRLRAILVGGAAAPFALLEECGRRGVPALTTYGLTEACSQITAQRPRTPYSPALGSGAPLPGAELRILEGRIHVRGPMLMEGYFRGPDRAPDPAVDEAGWFDTGDLGELDAEGNLHVLARRTDLIVTGGENVYPIEVEQRLEELPGVRRALVFGVPDARWGHLVAAAIELDRPLSDAAILAHAAACLAPHKRPRRLCVVPALPLTSSGKLDRKDAAARWSSLLRPL